MPFEQLAILKTRGSSNIVMTKIEELVTRHRWIPPKRTRELAKPGALLLIHPAGTCYTDQGEGKIVPTNDYYAIKFEWAMEDFFFKKIIKNPRLKMTRSRFTTLLETDLEILDTPEKLNGLRL